MRLSEYLHSKMGPPHAITWRARTVEQLEEWIIEWRREHDIEVVLFKENLQDVIK